MKCPKCGYVNRSTMPHCVKCGCELNAKNSPSWLDEVNKNAKPKKFIHVDERGEAETSTDPRDALAGEMVDLDYRQEKGLEVKKQLKEQLINRRRKNTTQIGFIAEEENQKPNSEQQTVAHSEFAPDIESNSSITYETENMNTNPYYEYPIDPKYTGYNYNPEDDIRIKSIPSDRHIKMRRQKKSHLLAIILSIIFICIVILSVYLVQNYRQDQANNSQEENVLIEVTMLDDMAAHTIMIPGEEGQQIYIRELRNTYIVTNGYAIIEVADYTWYESFEDYIDETMQVTLTPFLKKDTGEQIPLTPITYTIEIPLSPINIISPESNQTTIFTSIYNIKIDIRTGSTLYINGEDFSDIVNTNGGEVSYNATVKPIGENRFTIAVRSQYCRLNQVDVIINRPKQDITVELATDISSISTYDYMTIKGETLPGARITVSSPHSDLNVTELDSSGAFSFIAVFDKIGINPIEFTVSKSGLEDTYIKHDVYYVPNIDIYSRKAWAMDDFNYNDFLNNASARIKKAQIYVCIGTVESFLSTEPQLAIMNCGTESAPINVLLQNETSIKWELNKDYRIYADVFGMYQGMPRLYARYCYVD